MYVFPSSRQRKHHNCSSCWDSVSMYKNKVHLLLQSVIAVSKFAGSACMEDDEWLDHLTKIRVKTRIRMAANSIQLKYK
jgi:hypothetical protein